MGAARGTSTGLIGATHGPNQTQSPRDWGRDWRAVSDWPCAFDGVFRRGCTTAFILHLVLRFKKSRFSSHLRTCPEYDWRVGGSDRGRAAIIGLSRPRIGFAVP